MDGYAQAYLSDSSPLAGDARREALAHARTPDLFLFGHSMGGLYLPADFVAEPTQTVLVVLGVVLLLGGNVVMVVAHNDE